MKKYIAIALLISLTTISLFAQTAPRRNRQAGKQPGSPNRQDAAANQSGAFVVGKNRFTTMIDGDTREYYVHVPKSYTGHTPVPVVFMLHGTSGDGLKFYNISGWKEVGEEENLLTVYPSSWRHCIIEGGKRKTTTKWHVYPGTFEYCAGETPKDDVKFLNQAINEMLMRFSVNPKMIYFVGFSNGGQMTARVGVEMSDRVAAVVSSAGRLETTTSVTPQRLLPNLFQIGTNDPHITPVFGGNPAPMNFDQLFQTPAMRALLAQYVNTYKLNPSYTTAGDPNKMIWLDARGLSGNPNNVFRMVLIKGLEHSYPNGKNFPLAGAKVNWNWLKQFRLP